LNLIPFGALVDERGEYLIETSSFTYLTTGRDLLRLQTRSESKQEEVIVADPDFDTPKSAASDRTIGREEPTAEPLPAAVDASQHGARAAADFSRLYFRPLPGTAGEAQALKEMFRGATVLTRKQAAEAVIKQVDSPAILHVATHGFFLEDVVNDHGQSSDRGLLIEAQPEGERLEDGARVENPLLRSGLALAGANLRQSDGEDGVVTALEVAGLNLRGTKLVVLSACDTGVGEVKNGEGVYGLRRALVLAGSETQVMSLWPVQDISTRDLMIDYYRGLRAGEKRGEALRQAQLRMLSSRGREHPAYWASFIQSGEWASLDGQR
jgi:CHAT domain-containing protein